MRRLQRIQPGRWLLALLLLCLTLRPPSAGAASPAAAPAAPPSSVELERLVAQLRDPAARARLVAELQALIVAQRAADLAPSQAAAQSAKPAAVAPFGGLWQRIDAAAREVVAGGSVLLDAGYLFGWIRDQVADPAARQHWVGAAYAFVLVFGPALIAELILRYLLARAPGQLPVRRGDSYLLRALFVLVGFALDALPIAVFGAAAYGAVVLMPDGLTPAKVMLSVLVEATVEARLVLCVARAVLVPADAGTVLLPVDAATRSYLETWLRRFVLTGIYGYAIPRAGWWLGLPGALYAVLLKGAGLALAFLAIVFVLQNRAAVARRLAGEPTPGSGWGRLRRTIGEIWHLGAILYIVGLYLIYALHIVGGFAYVLRASLLSLAVIFAARLLVHAIGNRRRRGITVSSEVAAKFPTLERRANRYLPILGGLSAAAVYGLAGLAALRAWDVPVFAWLGSALGQDIAMQLLSTGLILGAALVMWEVLDSAIERYLSEIGAGAAARRSRLPTLLPFLRTAALCIFVVLVGLTLLSHVGINIAPLLAGAGIIGVAIGFGSQTLVKDIITGLFMLIEDQLAVGDVVDLGSSHRGVVEAITIRTLSLRDQAGTVHTVPFSSVTTVKNLTKDFAYVVARITISYSEDIDRVVAILREVCDRLMDDADLRPLILDPFDYKGVDSLDEFWVTLLLRIRTSPLQQWTVGRAFNRLVKIAFDEHGISTRDPNPITLVGAAPTAAAEIPRDAAPERCRA